MDKDTVRLRPALPIDLPAIAAISIAAHPHHPLAKRAWRDLADAYPIFLSRYELFFSLPYYHFVVAAQIQEGEEEIVGFVIWKEGGIHDEVEFKPQLPESANVEMIQYFLGVNMAHQKALSIEEMAELEVLDVKPGFQRRGIGGLLLGSAVEEVDKRDEKMYVRSSRVGKGLYEKFGWKVMREEEGEKGFKIELKDYGLEEDYTTWDMVRDLQGVR